MVEATKQHHVKIGDATFKTISLQLESTFLVVLTLPLRGEERSEKLLACKLDLRAFKKCLPINVL